MGARRGERRVNGAVPIDRAASEYQPWESNTGRIARLSLSDRRSVGVANNTSWDSNTAPAPMNTLWKGAKTIWTESLKGCVKVRMTECTSELADSAGRWDRIDRRKER